MPWLPCTWLISGEMGAALPRSREADEDEEVEERVREVKQSLHFTVGESHTVEQSSVDKAMVQFVHV